MGNPTLSRAIQGLMGGESLSSAAIKMVRKPRKRLWELDKHLHCPIIGTCLSLADLERAIKKAGVSWTRRPMDIDIHHVGVKKAGEDCRLARNLGKLLDKRYARHLSRIAELSTDKQLQEAWQKALDSGEVPGTLWAVATHPAASESLLDQVHGDVHMLSHLNGASHRSELARLKALEKEASVLRESLHRARSRQHEAMVERDVRIRQLEDQAAKMRTRLVDDPGSRYLESELDGVRRNLARAELRAERAESRLAEREQRLDEYTRDRAALKELLEETRAELALAERRLQALLDSVEGTDTARPDLAGQRVLYIGGHASLAPHLRRLVEQSDGSFNHHDGGLEDNRSGLTALVQAADLVFCPVDCVSHDACLRAKQACRGSGVRFLPLRSAGLSSFAAALERLPTMCNQVPSQSSG